MSEDGGGGSGLGLEKHPIGVIGVAVVEFVAQDDHLRWDPVKKQLWEAEAGAHNETERWKSITRVSL